MQVIEMDENNSQTSQSQQKLSKQKPDLLGEIWDPLDIGTEATPVAWRISAACFSSNWLNSNICSFSTSLRWYASKNCWFCFSRLCQTGHKKTRCYNLEEFIAKINKEILLWHYNMAMSVLLFYCFFPSMFITFSAYSYFFKIVATHKWSFELLRC